MQITNTFDPARIRKIMERIKSIQNDSKDFVADRKNLSLRQADGDLCLVVGGQEVPEMFCMGRRALRQLLSTLSIPVRYADRLEQAGHRDLLIDNANTLLDREEKRHMVRTLGGSARAILSDRYRPIDNYDVLKVIASESAKVGGELWDLRCDHDGGEFRALLVNDKVREQVNTDRDFGGRWRWSPADRGDPYMYPAVTIRNSETGEGSFNASLSLLNGICCNFFVWEKSVTQVHLGAQKEVGELIASDETRHREGQLILSRTRDVLHAAFDPEKFREIAAKVNETTKRNLPEEAKATEVVNATIKLCGLHEEHAEMVLEQFLTFGDRTQFGLANALNEIVNPENRNPKMSDEDVSAFEDAAGQVLALDAKAFGKLVAV